MQYAMRLKGTRAALPTDMLHDRAPGTKRAAYEHMENQFDFQTYIV